MTSRLHVRPRPPDAQGRIHHVTPASAGWEHVGFDLHRLSDGQSAAGGEAGREVALVMVEGAARLWAGGVDFGLCRGRESVFEHVPPFTLYVPAGAPWRVTAEGRAEVAVCSAKGEGLKPARLIRPEETTMATRGKGGNTRYVHPMLMEDRDWAERLLVTEVYTPPGHWSSYPSHKHDTDDFPKETYLEETYYHRLNPGSGFGYQRVYTDRRADGTRELDENMAVADGDVTLVPKGYHPCGVPWGYEMYYLNVMAGPRRAWRFTNDPDHDWVYQRDLKT